MLKATLRREMLQKRAQYTATDVTALSQKISKLFFAHFSLKAIRTVHVFLPIRKKNEVDTWAIIHRLWQDYPQIKVVVSISNTKDFTLSHFNLLPKTKLVENQWGIPEPEGSEMVVVNEIDIVMVPLLAFDAQGHRVGYGKGFYDRFLSACRPDTVKIGLSLEEQVQQIVDVHEDDIVLNYAITPTLVYHFK